VTRPRVLCVDDDRNVLDAHRRTLRREFDVDVACGPYEGLQMIADDGPYAAVLADHQMPEMDGVTFLTHVGRCAPQTSRVMLTGQGSLEIAQRATNEGSVFRFLVKPCPSDRLIDALREACREHERQRSAARGRLEATTRVTALESRALAAELTTVFVAARMLQSRVPWWADRARRMPGHCVALATELARREGEVGERCAELGPACLLYDIGLVGLPDALLGGAALDPEQRRAFERHTLAGEAILRAANERFPGSATLAVAADTARWHHERHDGGGYPDGLTGDRCPLHARIVALADAYEDLRTGLLGPPAVSHSEACAQIAALAGSAYDPSVVEAFLACSDEFEGALARPGATEEGDGP
jgi:response regulator RpfG family c-di-GMP phosphodiesterase